MFSELCNFCFGAHANNLSYDPPPISSIGRFVAFTSEATNLVVGAKDVLVGWSEQEMNKDCEGLPQTGEAFTHVAMTLLVARRSARS